MSGVPKNVERNGRDRYGENDERVPSMLEGGRGDQKEKLNCYWKCNRSAGERGNNVTL